MTATKPAAAFRPIYWLGDRVRLLDQTLLPSEEVWLELDDYRDVISAIREMRIRGAPAVGIAGAYAVALAAREIAADDEPLLPGLMRASEEIRQARPTGANLAWAVDRMLGVAREAPSTDETLARLAAEAVRIQEEDEEADRRMARLGADLIPSGSAVLTHCNTGSLATGGYGTALGVIRTAWAEGRVARVFATETRPLLQGARLTTWELLQDGIQPTLIADSAAAHLLSRGEVHAVVVGADRIAANGDVANKVGTYGLALASKESGVPFYVTAPTSTVDLGTPSGDSIPIEERPAQEVTHAGGVRLAPDGVDVYNPAFDVTPAAYVTAIVTEAGVATPPYPASLRSLMEAPSVG